LLIEASQEHAILPHCGKFFFGSQEKKGKISPLSKNAKNKIRSPV
jgi:hypothetical protein